MYPREARLTSSQLMARLRMRIAALAVAAAATVSATVSAQASSISVAWSSVIRPLQTVAGFQTVVNPVTTRESPYHDAVYEKIASLKAPFQRYVPWLPYPRLGIAELEPPSTGGQLCSFVNSGGPGNIWSAKLDCGAQGAGTIDGITLADYGHSTGFCGAITPAPACSKDVRAAVTALCVGKAACEFTSSDEVLGTAPCAGVRLAVQATCSNKAVQMFTYWNFTLLDEGMLDFLTAADSSVRTSIPNFSTPPNFLFNNTDRSYFPDDPLGETFSYEKGLALADPTGTALGDYYGRLLAYYIEGGFVDEAGRFHKGYNLTFSHWEVLNEVNGEHRMSPAFYTLCYDAIVAGIKRWAPNGSKNLKFVGIGGAGPQYVSYFLRRANHVNPDVQIGRFLLFGAAACPTPLLPPPPAPLSPPPPPVPSDVISLHHYASSAHRNGGNVTLGGDYEAFFPSGDGFISELAGAYANIAASDYPHVMIDADEVGVILPDDNDPIYTANQPGFPAVYWNAAAAMYAYIFGRSAVIGLDVLGESQLIGYPSIPFPRGAPYNGNWTAPPQYPSVTLLSWGGAFGQPGDGTARYWVLKMLVDEMRAGPPAGTLPPAQADWLVNTTVYSGSAPLSSPFCAETINLSTLSMFCATGVINAITFASYGTPSLSGSCGSWAVNTSCNAANSSTIVSAACLGKSACSIDANTPTFGDPCRDVVKHLAVEATCSSGGGAQVQAGAVYAQAFVEAAGTGARKILIVNTKSVPQNVSYAGAAGGTWIVIDESTAYGPAARVPLTADEHPAPRRVRCSCRACRRSGAALLSQYRAGSVGVGGDCSGCC